jgi:hypothetical protein
MTIDLNLETDKNTLQTNKNIVDTQEIYFKLIYFHICKVTV